MREIQYIAVLDFLRNYVTLLITKRRWMSHKAEVFISYVLYKLSAIVLSSNDFKIQITAILFSAKCRETFFPEIKFPYCVLPYLSYDNHAKLFGNTFHFRVSLNKFCWTNVIVLVLRHYFLITWPSKGYFFSWCPFHIVI